MDIGEAVGLLGVALDSVLGGGGGRKGKMVLEEFMRLAEEYEGHLDGGGGFVLGGTEEKKNSAGPVWLVCSVCGEAHDPREDHREHWADEVLPILDPPEGPQSSEGASDAGHDHVVGSDPSTHVLPGKGAK
jgi:hypothetical protein